MFMKRARCSLSVLLPPNLRLSLRGVLPPIEIPDTPYRSLDLSLISRGIAPGTARDTQSAFVASSDVGG